MKSKCINNPNYTYSGKESSPLGKGYTADAEQVGSIMMGRDNTEWMVGIKNGVKVWNRVPTELAKEKAILTHATDDDAKIKHEEKVPEKEVAKEKAPAKKRTPASTKTKAPVKKEKTETESESESDSSDESESSDEEEAVKKAVVKPPPTKVAVKAKGKVPAKGKGDGDNASEKSSKSSKSEEKKPRQKTDLNYFMSYRLKTMGAEYPDMDHRTKFSKTASEWKAMSKEEKAAAAKKAKEFLKVE